MPQTPMRLFLAVTLPDEMQVGITRAVAPAREAAPAVRWVRAGLLHLTMKFLGERPAGDDVRVAVAARGALAGVAPFDVTVGGTGAFPNFRRPRVVWLDMNPPVLLAGVARRIDAALASLGYAAETRPFRAHVTLGRLNDAVPREQVLSLERTLRDVRDSWTLAVREVVLMRSALSQEGPTYTALHHVALGGA